ncbi:MAG: RNA-binding S4 domain-containing protein [Firmicutes bacterium]|nr:RNA-binding S4 domain-containing protein [Bacillota bacterium]
MRIDKFLKVARLIKRRTVAKSAADGNRVSVGGKAVKPSYSLKIGDEVTIAFGSSELKVRIKSLDEKTARIHPENLYEVI